MTNKNEPSDPFPDLKPGRKGNLDGLRLLSIAWIAPAFSIVSFMLGDTDGGIMLGASSPAVRVAAAVILAVWVLAATRSLWKNAAMGVFLSTALIGFGGLLVTNLSDQGRLVAYALVVLVGVLGVAMTYARR